MILLLFSKNDMAQEINDWMSEKDKLYNSIQISW